MDKAYYVIYTLEKNDEPKAYKYAGWFEASYTYNDSSEQLDIASWLKVLNDDPKNILKASALAQKILDYTTKSTNEEAEEA